MIQKNTGWLRQINKASGEIFLFLFALFWYVEVKSVQLASKITRLKYCYHI